MFRYFSGEVMLTENCIDLLVDFRNDRESALTENGGKDSVLFSFSLPNQIFVLT